jgi:hypothetical protein
VWGGEEGGGPNNNCKNNKIKIFWKVYFDSSQQPMEPSPK